MNGAGHSESLLGVSYFIVEAGILAGKFLDSDLEVFVFLGVGVDSVLVLIDFEHHPLVLVC